MKPSNEMVEQAALQTWFKTHPLGTPIIGSDERDMRAVLSAALTTELFDVDGANETMSETADRLTALKEGS